MSYGNSYWRGVDLQVPSSVGDLTLFRVYDSDDHASIYNNGVAFFEPPFGMSPTSPNNALRWRHSLFSHVWTVFGSSAGYWTLFYDDGFFLNFNVCGPPPCWATNFYENRSSRDRLLFLGTSFELHRDNGSTYIYSGAFGANPGSDVWGYFLTDIKNVLGITRAHIDYAIPDSRCQQPPTPPSSPGVPYISSVTTAEGTKLIFYYKVLPRPCCYTVPYECVLSEVRVVDRNDGGFEVPYVTYTYGLSPPDGGSDGGSEIPGVLALVQLPGGTQAFSYPANEFQVYANGALVADHVYDAGIPLLGYKGLSLATGEFESLQPSYTQNYQTQPPTNCSDGYAPYVNPLVINSAQAGDGTSGNPGFRQDYWMQFSSSTIQRDRPLRVVDSCSNANSCSPGYTEYDWSCTIDLGGQNYKPGVEVAVKDKRDNWTAYSYADAGAGAKDTVDGGTYFFAQLTELTSIKKGATDNNGSNAIEQETRTYTYDAHGRQLLASQLKPSVLGGGSNQAEERYNYDPSNGRLKSRIKKGWTNVFSAGTWQTQATYVGTFYFTNHACLADAADPMLRTLEVHGPCAVSGFGALDCDAGGTVPITQSYYWPSTDMTNRASRLSSTRRYTNNTGTSCTSASHLDTTYPQYSPIGDPTSITDENGVVTTLTYEAHRVMSSTTAGLTTTYTYDGEKLSSVKYPQGNYEVFCYRSGTTAGCTGGTWNSRLQWKARSAVADGSTWSEKVAYTYWPDGTLASETYRGACSSSCTPTSGQVRRVVKHAADAHQRPTWDQAGDATGSYVSTRFFDRADNLAGIGFGTNTPPAFCGGPLSSSGTGLDSPLSHLCSSLGYDRVNRLIGLDEYPSSSGAATRSCLTYDAHGNVASVRTGCSANGTPGDCSSCTAPASTYQSDDFGNFVSATLPWTDNGAGAAGTTRYAYDAAGHLLTKQTPAMAQTGDYLTYAYDSLGRTLSLTHHYTQPSAGNELLFTFAYDTSATLDPSCPQPTNTKGRMLYRNDSFGTTWYRYDAFGRVLQEVRLRTGTTTCSASTPNLNPHTTYTYSNNGNVTSVTYPYGRTVTYGYGTGALVDRVANISVTQWNGTSWTTQSNLISAVAWEPYGGLRGYQIKHPTTSTTSGVEYFLGDNGANPPSPACPTSVPSTGSSDHTGRVRALWVSTGNFSPGTGNGATYKRTYTWQADQLKEEDTCLLGATTASTVTYAYDQLLRVTSAGRPGGNFAAAGGSIGSRAYVLNGRGNRTGETREDCTYQPTYGQSAFPDRVTRQASSCTGAILKYDYAYDRDGRTSSKKWPVDSSGDAGTTMLFASGGLGSGTNGALDSVFKSVSINGAVYNYYYDALNRRRLKVYPSGPKDEAFHDTANQFIVDQGNDAVLNPTTFPVDEYVWLDGRPVMLVRSKMSTSWVRQADATGDCTRNGDAAPCGFYFPVTDIIGKPVLMLDSSRRVSGAAEYDVFGFPNRVSLDKETAHPYANNSNLTLADFTQAIGGTANPSTQVRVRAIFDLIDTEGPVATPADYVFLKDPDGGVALTSNIGGPHRGQVWSPWVIPSAGRIQVPFLSNATGNTYTGVVMAGYEYQRFQSGAQPIWTPLGFPGQYHDAETDLFQNWNRFYDASVGRYLGPEPAQEKPVMLTITTVDGHALPVYGYGQNNPLDFLDFDGLFTTLPGCKHGGAGDAEACKAAGASIADPNLRACVIKRCDDGIVKCRPDFPKCKEPKTCAVTGRGGSLGDPRKTVIYCDKPYKDPNRKKDCDGKVTAHEFAHACGWQHDGDPLLPGEMHDSSVPGANSRLPGCEPID